MSAVLGIDLWKSYVVYKGKDLYSDPLSTLDWSTPGPFSFSNSSDCVIILFSERSVDPSGIILTGCYFYMVSFNLMQNFVHVGMLLILSIKQLTIDALLLKCIPRSSSTSLYLIRLTLFPRRLQTNVSFE